MKVSFFAIDHVPEPWRTILAREVDKLRARSDVAAIGVAGSLANDDTWSHSDIDIEVVLTGEHEFTVLNTEQEISVDFGFFGESNLDGLPDETRPIYDPHEIIAKQIRSRDMNQRKSQQIDDILKGCKEYLKRAEDDSAIDPKSTLVFLHLYAWHLSGAITISAGDKSTIRRKSSRLERAVRAHHREDLLADCNQIYGFPKTLKHSRELLLELQEGYREVWPFFKGKTVGPRYMLQQPDSELWFHNRIEPVYESDSRDLVWLVYLEFPFVTSHLFRNIKNVERLPPNMFEESRGFPEGAGRWISRQLHCLELFDKGDSAKLLEVAQNLFSRAREFVSQRHYLR